MSYKNLMIGIIALTFLFSILAYDDVPDEMASHWNIEGEVDDYMDKKYGLFLMPGILVLLGLMFIAIPRIDPLKRNIKKFEKHYFTFVIIFMLIMLGIHGQVILWNLGYKISPNVFFPLGIGFLFFYLGFLCEKSRRNWFIGIRTPWTLSSERVWDKTHKKGATLYKISGVLAMLGVIWPRYSFFLIFIPVVSVSLYLVYFSYAEYKRR